MNINETETINQNNEDNQNNNNDNNVRQQQVSSGYYDKKEPISRQQGTDLDDSKFQQKKRKQFQNQHTFGRHTARESMMNENRGELFKKVQLDVNIQRMKEDILKKARQGMTDKEWDEFHFIPNFFVHGKKFRFSQKSYFLFDTQNKFRQSLVWLMEWRYFDMFITFTILSNTVILMLQDYSFRLNNGSEQSWNSDLISYSEIVFAIIFIIEFFVKSLAMGLVFEKYTYLREGWNIIDFIVVITSIVSFFPQMLNLSLSAIRTFRILRPLRTINYVEGMRILIGSLIESLPDLGNVVVFLTFIITLFGVLSLQLFSDVFENRCRITPWPVCFENSLLSADECKGDVVWEIDTQVRYLCELSSENSCPSGLTCGNPNQYKNITQEQNQQLIQQQLDYPEFNYGFTRFDNIFFAIFTIFQSLTTEGWTQVVFILIDTFNPTIVYTYFICLIFLGSFFVVNLILAVINESFINQHKKNQEKQVHKKRLDQLEENLQQIEEDKDKHFKDAQESVKDDSSQQESANFQNDIKDDTLISDQQSESEQSIKNMHKSIRKKKMVNGQQIRESNMMLSRNLNNLNKILKPIVKSNQSISSMNQLDENDEDQNKSREQQKIHIPYKQPQIQLMHTEEDLDNQRKNKNKKQINNSQEHFLHEKSYMTKMNHENSELLHLSDKQNNISYSDIEFKADGHAGSSGEKQKRIPGFQREQSKQQTDNTRKQTQQTQNNNNLQNQNDQENGIQQHYKINTQDILDKSPETIQLEKQFFSNKGKSKKIDKKEDDLENDCSQNSIHCEETQRFPDYNKYIKNFEQEEIKQPSSALHLNVNLNLSNHKLNKSDYSPNKQKISSNGSTKNRLKVQSVSQRSIQPNAERNQLKNQQDYRKSFKMNSSSRQKNRSSMLKTKSILLHNNKNHLKKMNTIKQQGQSILRANKKSNAVKQSPYTAAATSKKNSLTQKSPSLARLQARGTFKFQQSTVQKGTFRYKVRYFVEQSSIFLLITTSFILANTIVLALDKYPQDESYENTLEILNIIFTFVFFFEMILKLYGQGLVGYVQDRFNVFDGLIVVLSLVEVILKFQQINELSGGGFSAITAFRSLRLFRIFKLARSWHNLRHLLLAIYKTLGQIVYFMVLVMLFIIVTSLLGMEFFSYKIRFNDSGNLADPDMLHLSHSPRQNFDTLPDAIITIFILLTNEEWNAILYDHMRGMQSWWPCAFFISVVVIGNFMLLKLFLAILIYNFAKSSQETKEQEELLSQKKQKEGQVPVIDQIKQKFKNCCCKKQKNKKYKMKTSFNVDRQSKEKESIQQQLQQIQKFGKTNDKLKSDYTQPQSSTEFNRNVMTRKQTYAQNQYQQYMKDIRQNNGKTKTILSKFNNSLTQHQINSPNHAAGNLTTNNLDDNNNSNVIKKEFSESMPNEQLEKIQKYKQGIQLFNVVNQAQIQSDVNTPISNTQQESPRTKASSKFFNALAIGIVSQSTQRKRINHKQDKEEQSHVLVGNSLFIFTPQNKFRIWVHNKVKNQKFEAFVIFLIICSSILLTIDSPLDDPSSELQQNLRIIDYFVTFLFVIECFMKIIHKGFLINGNKSYLRSYWNQLDFLIVIISLVSIFLLTDINLDKLKIFRILRILRPLRLISRNKGLKVAINSILKSIPNILNLLVVCLIFFLLFGIFGTNYFKGSFFYCEMTNVYIVQKSEINTKTDCLDYGGDWINNDYNFDNIMSAMLNLFVLSTTEGWVQMMSNGIDSVGIDQEPQFENRKAWVLFYIFFIIVGAFFIMNLFAGIVVDSFNQEKDKIGGISLLSPEQKEWIEVQIRILNTQPISIIEVNKEKTSVLRKLTFKLVTHKYFEITILILIVTNTLVFMAIWNGQSQEMEDVIRFVNYGFLGLFTLEAILKLIAFKIEYFKDVWNQFDITVVVITYIGLALEYTEVFQNIGTSASIVRTFRIVRVLRLVKRAKSIQMIFNTFIITIPALVNIGALLTLVLFLFSVLGMNLFSFIKYNASTMGINEKSNFQTFFESFFLLLKCSTGEEWNLVLADIVRQQSPSFACHQSFSYQEYIDSGKQFLGCGNSAGYIFLIAFQLLFAMIVLSLFVAVILEGFDKTLKDEHSMVKPHNVFQFVETWKQYDKKAIGLLEARELISLLKNVDEPLGWNGLKISESRQRILVAQMDLPVYKLRNLKQPFVFYYDVLGELSRQCILSELPMGTDLEPIEMVQAQKDIHMMLKFKLNQYRHLKDTEYTTADYIAVQIMAEKFKNFKNNKKLQLKDNQQASQDQILEKPENEEDSQMNSKRKKKKKKDKSNGNSINNSSEIQDMGSLQDSSSKSSSNSSNSSSYSQQHQKQQDNGRRNQTLQSDDNSSNTSHNMNLSNNKSQYNDKSRIKNKKSLSDISNHNNNINILDNNTTQIGQFDTQKLMQNQENPFFQNQLNQKNINDDGIYAETFRKPSELGNLKINKQISQQNQMNKNNSQQRTTNIYSNQDLQVDNASPIKSNQNINMQQVLSDRSQSQHQKQK